MLIMPAWAMLIQLQGWWDPNKGWWKEESYLLVFIAIVTLSLEVWMLIEAVLMWPRAKGVLEEALPPLEQKVAVAVAATSAAGGPNC